MKYIWVVLALLVLAGAAGYVQYGKEAPVPETVRVLMVQDTEDLNFFFDFAEAKGLFEKNGVRIERIFSSGNQPEMLLGGGADVYAGTSPVMLAPFFNGADLKVVAGLFRPTSFFGLSRFKESEFQKIKKVALTTPSPTSRVITESALKSMGVDPSRVEYQIVPGNAPKEKLLSEGKLDLITVNSGDFVFRSGAEDKYTVIGPEKFLSSVGMQWSLISTGKSINDKPELLRRFVKAAYDASIYMREHREEALSYLEEKGYDRQRAEQFYGRIAAAGLAEDFLPRPEYLRNVAERTVQIAEPNQPERPLSEFIFADFAAPFKDDAE